MSEWDDTPWSGSIVASSVPVRRVHPDSATIDGKAVVGPWANVYSSSTPSLDSLTRNPQALMKRAQLAYHTNPWIRAAEAVVTRRVVGLPWHLEDGNEEEYKTPLSGDVLTVSDLFEKPQAALTQGRQMTRRELWAITSRHIGLCGMAHWFKDQVDANGLPAAYLYINPVRMIPVQTESGILTRWSLDPKDRDGNGGTPIELSDVLTFYLDPPDWGNVGSGLYEAALLKAQVTHLGDQHAAYVIGTGGRIPGIVSPKTDSIPDDKFQAVLNEFRNVNEAPDAAKRTTVMQGPIDFVPTAANPQELDLIAISTMNRDDIFAIWGVPPSQASIQIAAGMNSGDTKGYDEAILMQGAVHDRVVAITETIQYQQLDKLPTPIELVIEEPEFDDATPAYDRAQKAREIPLTNKERRDIVGLEPFGDPRDLEVWLPSGLIVAYEASGTAPEPNPIPPGLAPFTGQNPPSDLETDEVPAAKASGRREFLGLRKSVDTRWVPATRERVEKVLIEQRKEVAAKLRSATPVTIKANLKRPEYWFGTKREDERLARVLRPTAAGIVETVTERVTKLMTRPRKADPFADKVAQFVDGLLGTRISGINRTTRDAIGQAVATGFADGLSPAQIADSIEGLPAFDPARAELVARTETMLAYNEAALQSYREYDVERVQAYDGDEDPVCAERDGQVFTIEEAAAIEDHPNGTLDWAPYFGEAAPAKAEPEPIIVPVVVPEPAPREGVLAALKAILEMSERPVPEPVFNVAPAVVPPVDMGPIAEAIKANTEQTIAAVAALMAQFKHRPVSKIPVRDERGVIIRIDEVMTDGQ